MKMSVDKKPEKKRRLSKILLMLGVAVLVLAVAAAIAAEVGVRQLDKVTDGTENFSGVKLEAAQNVLAFDRGFNSDYPFRRYSSKAHVEAVEPSPQGKDSEGKPLRCTDDPNEIQYYSVTIRRVWLFGITYDKTEYKVCNTAG